jgi:hypothetical protein
MKRTQLNVTLSNGLDEQSTVTAVVHLYEGKGDSDYSRNSYIFEPQIVIDSAGLIVNEDALPKDFWKIVLENILKYRSDIPKEIDFCV